MHKKLLLFLLLFSLSANASYIGIGSAIQSINGNSKSAQTIVGGTGISVSSSGGTTTITDTGIGTFSETGNVALTSGTVTVTTANAHTASRIFLSVESPGAFIGALYVSSVNNGVNFTIQSTSSTDTSTVSYMIVN